MTVLLTRKAVVQVALEDTYDTAATVGLNDGLLVSNPMFTVKPNVLERNFVRNDLSPMAFIVGRMLAGMTFDTELRSNGRTNTGLLSNSPLIARLFQACGYALTAFAAPSVNGPFVVGDAPTSVAWAVTSATLASQVHTATGNFVAGDVQNIGGKAYTFQTVLTNVDGNVLLGATEAISLANLKAAVNLGAGAGTLYAAATAANPFKIVATSASTTITISGSAPGAYANAVAVSYTPAGSVEGAWGAATLVGGVNVAANADMVEYTLSVVTPGASGTATIQVNSDTVGETAGAPAVISSGSAFPVGTLGLQFTPVFSGLLVAGQKWVVWLRPAGLSLDPVSDSFQSATFAMHKDGVLHTMPGSYGTFEITAQAGNFASIKWTMTGTYDGPVDDANPAPVFETTLPSQVENARLLVDEFAAVVEKFTFTQGNDIQIRPSVNASEGYVGVRIVSRKPEGGIDPEADLVANNDFWDQMSAAQRMPFQMRVGFVPGNTIWVTAPCTQYSGLTYADRNGILVYDAGLRFSRVLGNDEVSFFFA